MSDKIGIMGAGALGSYVGAFLSREGEDVTFVDMWPEHVEKMRADGLHVTGSQGPFTVPVKAMHLTEAQGITEPFDFVFVSVKSYDTEWATHFIKRYVKDDGFFVSLQNCWNDVIIAGIVGEERTVGCIASHIEVALWEPGHVTRGGAVGRDHGHHVFRVAEVTGVPSRRSDMVAGLLDNIDGAYSSTNLFGERWAKLCQNSMGNGISAASGLGSQQMAEDPAAASSASICARRGRRWVWPWGWTWWTSTACPPRPGPMPTRAMCSRSWTGSWRPGEDASTGWRPWRRTYTRGAAPRSTL